MALKDLGARRGLAAELRTSTERESKNELDRFVARSYGSQLLQRSSTLAGTDLAALTSNLPPMDIYLPLEDQRRAWTGDQEMWVLGTTLTDHQVREKGLTHLPAYDTDGNVHMVSMTEPPSVTLISIVP